MEVETTRWILVGVGLVMSVFYGAKAPDIFVSDSNADWKERWKKPAFRFHQTWLNFLGSAAGWVMLGFLIERVAFGARPALLHAAPVAIGAFLGVTGYLPVTVVSFAMAVGTLAEKATNALAK